MDFDSGEISRDGNTHRLQDQPLQILDELVRHGVDHARNNVVVHDSGQAGDILGNRDAFVLGLMSEHRAGNDVANRPDAGDAGAEVMLAQSKPSAPPSQILRSRSFSEKP